ncbi:MAG: NADH-quinone oxidoreductase subunit NuoG [Burkholderiaceae bacterium]
MVQIEIDGKAVEVNEGSMVMDAANKLGIYVPHFCYHKKLTIAANCRMCLVDVEKAPKPMPACATPVTAGMIVRTASPKAIQAQKGVMEFLLINHPLDCPICDQGGECQLQDLAVGYGASNSRYKEEKRVVFEKNVGPLISMKEMTRCIHCTRCVRFGQEIAGVMEFGMLGRGEHAEITTFVGKTVDSELSGNMIDICPVGALTSKPFRYAARTWELSRRKSVSPHDGLGANLIVQVKNNEVLRVVPFENDAINECWLSDKDRFSYEALSSADRLTKPMLKEAGQWREVDWPEALEFVASGLKRIVDDGGASQVGALATPHSTLEELYLLQKLMRGIGSDNIDTRLRQSEFGAMPNVAPALGMSIAAFGKLDRVLVIGSFLRKDQPLLAQRLRQSIKRGALLSVLHATDDDLLMPVANKAILPPSQWVAALGAIESATRSDDAAAGSSDAVRSIAKSFASGSAKAILLGSAVVQHPHFSKIYAAARTLATATGATLGFLTDAANSVGAHIVKALPVASGLDAAAMLTDARRAYLLLNVEPDLDFANPVAAAKAFRDAELVVSMTAFRSAADRHADVLLPISPFSETSGTFVNTEGRAQSFNGTVKPRGETRPAWKVLRVLGNLLGVQGFDFESSEAVRTEITGGAMDLSDRCGPHEMHGTGRVTANPYAVVDGGIERIADVPIYFADALVRRSPPLQATHDGAPPKARMNGRALAAAGLVSGDAVRVSIDGGHALLTCLIDETVADGCIRIAAAHASTAGLPSLFGSVTVTKLAPSAAVPSADLVRA